ncbi:Murein DD-endopeptidase MepM and murein hydrolase activator NlpD, contain LysM domain [Lachnospiraceae bacterium]|nr:Murein DD-endopeptidase MepM and murein hydrolase activator NlpD, contain LysM domain [Lachnospiraceae bacterium]
MNKKSRITMIVLVLSFFLTAGVTSVTAKAFSGGRNTVLGKASTASPGDASEESTTEEKKKKEKEKTTEGTESTTEASTVQPVTVDIPQQTPIDTEELSQITAEYSKTLKEKMAVQEKLNLLMENQNDFIKRLHEIDDLIIEYQAKIDDINNKTIEIQNSLVALQEDIELAQARQDEQYERLKQHIAEEYENVSYGYMDALFNAVDYTDIVNKTEYIQAVDSYDNNILGQYNEMRTRLADKKAMLTMINSSMDVLEEAYRNEQDTLELLSKEKEKQINEFQGSIDKTQEEMAAIEAVEAAQTAQIAAIEAKYNVSISVTGLTTSIEYKGADFLWPMPTSTSISSYYGPRVAPTAGATSYHRGIDIPCPVGSGVIAVASGTVIYTGYLGNGGNCVIVDHGSGISTCYFHLSAFGCKVGDSVTAGQTICFSGNTGVSTGPHLHFAVRENGEYVNPLKYYKNIQDKSQVANTEGTN